MAPVRQCEYIPLSKQPLVMVLCQAKFSAIGNVAAYIPAVQDAFRKLGYPIQQQGKAKQLILGPAGMQVIEKERWVFLTRAGDRSVIIDSEQVVLQATTYERFEAYAEQLGAALGAALYATEHDRYGVLQRLGLRYVDLVRPRQGNGEDFRTYVQPGLRGLDDGAFPEGARRCGFEAAGRTRLVGDQSGTLVVRLHQNDQGLDLPPDLIVDAPKRPKRAAPGDLVTLIDIDHFWEGQQGPPIEADWVVERAYLLHDHIVNVFHSHVVTAEAKKIWA